MLLRQPARGPPASSEQRRSSVRASAAVPPHFVETRVTFQGVDGEQLVGTLRAPANADAVATDSRQHLPPGSATACRIGADAVATDSARQPIALLCHGYMSDREASVLLRLADALERRLQMPSLRWDFSGNGESEGRFRYGGYQREAKEIAAAATLARSRGYRVALLAGHSKGATSALLYAGGGGGEPVAGNLRVVNVAGRFDVREGVERRLGAKALAALGSRGRVEGMPGRRRDGESFEWTLYREDLDDRLSTDLRAYCAAVAAAAAASESKGASAAPAIQVLSLHCEGDADVPSREARRFHDALGGDAHGHRLVILPDGDHSFRAPHAAEALVEEVVAWAAAAAEGKR